LRSASSSSARRRVQLPLQGAQLRGQLRDLFVQQCHPPRAFRRDGLFLRQRRLRRGQQPRPLLRLGQVLFCLDLGRIRRRQQGQRFLCPLALFLQRQRHRRQLCIRALQPGAQGIGGGQVGQPGFLGCGQLCLGTGQIRLQRRHLGVAVGGPGLHLLDQQGQRIAARCGQTRRFGAGVNLVAGLGQRQLQRFFLADQPGAGRFQVADLGCQRAGLPARRIAFRQQGGDLLFKAGDPRLGCGKLALPGGQLAGQRGDQGRLLFALRLGRRKIAAQPADFGLQGIRAAAFQTQRIGQPGHLCGQGIQLASLGGDRLAQHRLNQHENCQHEHQHHQKRGHRIDEPRPDRAFTAGPAPGQGHGGYPRPAAPRDSCRIAVVSAARSPRRSVMLSWRPAEISSRMRRSCTSIDRRRIRFSASTCAPLSGMASAVASRSCPSAMRASSAV
jgi:hypothetical protein